MNSVYRTIGAIVGVCCNGVAVCVRVGVQDSVRAATNVCHGIAVSVYPAERVSAGTAVHGRIDPHIGVGVVDDVSVGSGVHVSSPGAG